MAIEQLERASVGRPITRGGVSLYPVYVHGGAGIDIAVRPEGVQITEQGSAEVPTITVTNPGPQPTLLVEGETVTGGQQNRVLNVSVLVPAGATINVPVSCVESGRWNGNSAFERGRTFAPRRVRRVKSATVSESVRHGGSKNSDQGAVWSTIDFELGRLHVDSSTRSIHASERLLETDNSLAIAAQELVSVGPLPGQCGIVLGHGKRIVAAEIFATPELLAANWEALIRAALLDAPNHVEGQPSVSRALRFVTRIGTARGTRSAGVGLGEELHMQTTKMVGQALTLNGVIVHASAFALAA
ncbi:MAG: DUF6569 family protein [Acidimicrobiales bacterium]